MLSGQSTLSIEQASSVKTHLDVVSASSPNTPEIDEADVENTQGVTGVEPHGRHADSDAVQALHQDEHQLRLELLRVKVFSRPHHAESPHCFLCQLVHSILLILRQVPADI